ncbi:helix-turn-helix domain-containing protein [Paraburkholderia sp. MMS20-SJTR3]|uniref:Helix-turn-helix domain-containing protein n=1 Tax=Paraburkholderia sejongensis TaxID=2886946 RepID=A0ABS8JZX8_9BURK|nr:helix-turn-helix domain-containing protein [Paraburkholderia sp. MMS20-SJTR3]MCC8395467.1 helix-turn-helix domain-containing protein [Paraburkholderia sp. MMS20-SJTR3]
MEKVHIYLFGAYDPARREQALIRLDKAGYMVTLARLANEDLPTYFAARERPELQSLIRRMAPRDTLVVLELAALGCNARDILATVMQCRKALVSLKCVEIGHTDLAGRPEPSSVKVLRALVRLDAACRSLRSRDSLAAVRANGKHTGRPPSLSEQQRERVLQSLGRGQSVSEVARRFGTSRQTVMRIRADTPLT